MKPAAAASRSKQRVLIVDDHPLLREGLAQLINHEPDLCVCGEAQDAPTALAAIARARPNLVVVDLSLPGKHGLELIKDLSSLHPQLPVLVFSMHDEALYAERVLRAGGRGYVMKDEGGQRLLAAIRQVLGGHVYVSSRVSAGIVEGLAGRRPPASHSPVEQLTDREFEVLQLIGQGRGTREIAGHLHLSVKTVEAHRGNIKRKLNLPTGPALMRFAVQWVESEGP